MNENRFVLGVAYQAGRDPRIQKGADGGRDYFEPEELEKAAWWYASHGREVGTDHTDGTTGAGTVVESYIYRGPDWVMKDTAGEEVIVKSGDWLLGAILDDAAWEAYKAGRFTGWSPQGSGRRRVRKHVTVTVLEGDTVESIAARVAAEVED